VNCKRKSRHRLFLLMRSRTPPISSEFRRGGVWTPQTTPLGTPLGGIGILYKKLWSNYEFHDSQRSESRSLIGAMNEACPYFYHVCCSNFGAVLYKWSAHNGAQTLVGYVKIGVGKTVLVGTNNITFTRVSWNRFDILKIKYPLLKSVYCVTKAPFSWGTCPLAYIYPALGK
jgi:hypothetical protein